MSDFTKVKNLAVNQNHSFRKTIFGLDVIRYSFLM